MSQSMLRATFVNEHFREPRQCDRNQPAKKRHESDLRAE